MSNIQMWILVIGMFVILLKLSNYKALKINRAKFNYIKKDFLMSRAEHEFFDILISIVGNEYHIFPQIHLPTILNHKVTGQNWRGAFRHIDEKSVDFVLCDKKYIKPLLVIELDDKTHQDPFRVERDLEVESILKEAEVPILRIENRGSFNKDQIANQIFNALKQSV